MDLFFVINGVIAASEICFKLYHWVSKKPKEAVQDKLSVIAVQLEKIQNMIPQEYYALANEQKVTENMVSTLCNTMEENSVRHIKDIYDEAIGAVADVVAYIKENSPQEQMLAELDRLIENNPLLKKHLESYQRAMASQKKLYRLDCIKGPAKGVMLIIPESQEVKIGKKMEISFADDRLADEQCKLYLDHGNLYVEDLKSPHGTFVNLLKIDRPMKIVNEDSLILGRSFFVVTELTEKKEVRQVQTDDKVGECAGCGHPVTRHGIESHRAIPRKDQVYCMRCICEKKAGDFPTIGAYRILHRLGKGGMGDVYLAVQTKMYRLVTYKWLKNMMDPSPEKIRRFARECEIGARLSHPNIVQFYDAGNEEKTYYIVMEYVRGETLDEVLKKRGRLPANEVLAIAMQLLEALDLAYAERIVHRDIKPANIFLTPNGTVKLTDFGLSKYLDEVGLSSVETRSGMTMGTIIYMPPEQFANAKYVDHRADLYSFGATVYHLLAGHPPIPLEGSSIPDYLNRLLQQEPTPLSEIVPDIPSSIERVVHRCLSKNVEERYQKPSEVMDALKEATYGR